MLARDATSVRAGTVLIILTFVFNAGLNFLLGLVLARLLGPAEYGRFAIGATLAIVLATACFDWLRLSATRFYTEGTRGSDPQLRATLNASYFGLGALVALVAAGAAIFRVDAGLSGGVLAGALLLAIANARFDFATALARARFLEGPHTLLMVVKNAAVFASAVGVALWSRSAGPVLLVLAVATAASVLPARRVLADRAAPLRAAALPRLRALAVYGLPIVAANALYQVIALANRSAAASTLGFADAGQLSLATDLSTRLLLTAGAALDVHLFQLVVRRDAAQGRDAALAQLRTNTVAITAALLLLAVGYAGALPRFAALVVPPQYREDFVPVSLLLLPGILAFCSLNFCLNPVFLLAGRTAPVVWAGLAALGADLAGLASMPHRLGAPGYAGVHSASLLVGWAVAASLAYREPANRPPLRDMAATGTAAVLALAAIWPTRSIGQPVAALALAAVLGTSVYAAVLLWLDVAGARAIVRRLAARPLRGSAPSFTVR